MATGAQGCMSIPVYVPVDPNALPQTSGYLSNGLGNGLGLVAAATLNQAATTLNQAMQRPRPHPPRGKRRSRKRRTSLVLL